MSIKVKPGQIWAWKSDEPWAGELVIVIAHEPGHDGEQDRWTCVDVGIGCELVSYRFYDSETAQSFDLVQDV